MESEMGEGMSHHQVSPVERLNNRQRDVLELVCKGLRNAEVGKQLKLSERAVKGYVSQLFLIFDVTTRTELVAAYYQSDTIARKGSSAG